MFYGAIKERDVANGEGIRLTLFVSGCTNHCKGCFQPETWAFDYGQPYTEETEESILRFFREFRYADGLTLLGGEPFEPVNQEALVGLCRKVKAAFPDKSIWAYTGFYLFEDLVDGKRKHTEYTDELLTYIDVLVEGPFILEERNLALAFRGSENQHVLDLKKTLKEGKTILYLE